MSKQGVVNPWVNFLKQHRGGGYSISELRDLYMSSRDDAEQVYLYDDNADIKTNSMLEDLKADRNIFPDGIGAINRKLRLGQLDEISPREEEAWRLAFEMAITDEYTLTPQQLLNSHDWWLNRLLSKGCDEDIIERLETSNEHNLYKFLDLMHSLITIDQLYAIKHPYMS